MHPGKIMLLGALLLAVLIVLFIFYSHYREEMEKEGAYQELVEEGFVFLEDSGKEENVDEAIKLGLRARDLDPGGEAALLGATVAPGFDFEDFDLASRDALLKAHPHLKETIRAFTRNA